MASLAYAGGLFFIFSLGYFVFQYGVAFGIPVEAGNAPVAIAIDVALFTFFALHHSVFARLGLRDRVARIVSREMERSTYVWLASALFIGVCAFWQPVPGVAWDASGLSAWPLSGVQLFGAWLTLRSAAVLDFRELAGLPARASRAHEAGEPNARKEPEFKIVGPYGWVRHPIYTGWFLMVWAAVPMTNTRLVFAIVSCLYLLIAIPLEEQTLRLSSGGAYDRYSATVRWRLLPGVY